ncbi:I78 family peptidase inhibitor [Chromohalobacter sp. 296-RDG]|nr:I78 family peptidase inhibitor [Chromohalobacter sp. 296-RDG]
MRPDQAVTMDYRADRLNVKLDDQDTIDELTCG